MYKINIGTSGYYYQDWKGTFYPPELSTEDFLNYYSSIFNTVELNFTYYSLQRSFIFEKLVRKIEKIEDFVFSLKANRIFTHDRTYTISDVDNFLDSINALKKTNRLGCILFQFPYSFHFSRENLNYLNNLGNNFNGYEICAEFRNSQWLNNHTIDTLKTCGFGFCNVDEPHLKGLLRPTNIVTTKYAYIRFHGRNIQYWWNPEKSYQRYDYMYNQQELSEWIPKTKEMISSSKAKKIYIYFNNHYKGKAAKSAMMFLDLLKNNDIYIDSNEKKQPERKS